MAKIIKVIKRILFVCLGNICRSPSAEAVFRDVVKKNGMTAKIEIDSAGTSAWHAGEPADRRMQSHALLRGYNLNSISRKFDPDSDFDRFDLIVGMDDYNLRDLRTMARSDSDRKKIRKMTDFSRRFGYNAVPDPYYGGEEGFELVLDLLEDACEGLLEAINKKKL